MTVTVHFYSYFKDLAGCESISESVDEGSNLETLLAAVFERFPKLKTMGKSMLVAVGVEYQPRSHVLSDGDEVALFPPVQGG